ncbi:serine/threonine-protein kinase [Streptomyces sp. WMMC500]|uniref:serine/threonine-protein kinase n=1 Tax=Streptomyces sp. WMMC500 TaxID=3015154 RepID=UPI00248B0A3C|nr:serine/threonine-protein kinase [Streptomyces sp. WMMC500]WBB58107.1 serine/threonine-protein kinase [Streptomyces sp. WMMC500]
MTAFDALEGGDPRRVGPYRLLARLGAGGMGRVYLGCSPGGRAVAVKVVRTELAGNADFRRRFVREVTAARRVNGFFTAGVVDADPEGEPAWLATAYVPGMSLAEAVDAHGPWRVPAVLALGAGLAEALGAIHQAGVVHRDLKPANVLLAVDGPRVIDFGISAAGEAGALTRPGTVVGTPGFMCPEQVRGVSTGPAGDVFSLGAVLVFTATGVSPFGTGMAHAVNYRVVYEEPVLDWLEPGLRAVVARCLAKEPARRPTVPALVADLAAATGSERSAAQVLAHTGWLPPAVASALHARTHAAPARVSPARPDPPIGPFSGLPEGPYGAMPAGPVAASALNRPCGTGSGSGSGSGEGAHPTLPVHDHGPADTAHLSGPPGPAAASPPPAPVPPPAPRLPADERLLWAFATRDGVHSSPTVADAVVYFGSLDGNLYAVDAATGKSRWAFATGRGVDSSPTVAGGVAYVGSLDGMLYAVDTATGQQRWAFSARAGISSSPALADGVVYVGSLDGGLYAVDARTGTVRWTFATGAGVESSPAVAGGAVYVGSLDGNLYAVDAATGRVRWRFPTRDGVYSSPTVAEGVVHIASLDGGVYAVDAETGLGRWDFDTRAVVSSSPTVADGVVYVGGWDRHLYAVDAATGVARWRCLTGGAVYSSPAVAGGAVYVGSLDKHLYAVDAATGRRRWAFRTGGAVESSPFVAGGAGYVGSRDGRMYAVEIR